MFSSGKRAAAGFSHVSLIIAPSAASDSSPGCRNVLACRTAQTKTTSVGRCLSPPFPSCNGVAVCATHLLEWGIPHRGEFRVRTRQVLRQA